MSDTQLATNHQPVDPYRIAHRALRGRYRRAITVGLLTGAAAAIFAWHLNKPQFRSEAIVRLAYMLPPVLRDAGDQPPVELFHAFVQSQQALINSRRVVDLALQDPAWRKRGRGDSPQVIQHFADNLKVDHKLNTDYLRITFTDVDPAVAAAAVRSVVSAYERLFTEHSRQQQRHRIEALQARQQHLLERLESIEKRTGEMARDGGPGDVEKFYDAAAQQTARLTTLLNDIRLALALAQGRGDVPPVVSSDPIMRSYLVQREQAEEQLAQLRLRGYGENHQQVMHAKKALELADQRVRRHAGAPRGGDSAAFLAGRSVQTLARDEAAVRQLLADSRRHLQTLGEQRRAFDRLKRQADQLHDELSVVSQRLQTLEVEAGADTRLQIIAAGEIPISPWRDRRLALAGAAGAAGGLLPAALLVLGALLRPRYRYSDETEDALTDSGVPLLGILPLLPNTLNDPDGAATAAHGVHQIRVMLELRHAVGSRPVYLVSSASPGEGKTSVTAALGLSYAASGARTLLIDADLVGQRLTRSFAAPRSGGLFEALREGQINGQVRCTGTAGLWILPAGNATDADANTLTADPMRRLLLNAREKFDVILVDSGPILASVEANVIAPHADAVILVITRFQQRPLVERAVRHLRRMRANLAGMIFNRAETHDLTCSTGCSEFPAGGAARQVLSDPRAAARLGPVAGSLAPPAPDPSEVAVVGGR